jgi:TldD protein
MNIDAPGFQGISAAQRHAGLTVLRQIEAEHACLLASQEQVTPQCLSVTECASGDKGWGGFEIDDEGSPALSTSLLVNGHPVAQLLSKRHAVVRGAESDGHGIRATRRDPALPRFGRLRTEPSDVGPDSVLNDIPNGVFVHSVSSGEVNSRPERVVLRIRESQDIEHGRCTTSRRGGVIALDAASAFVNLVAVGSDFTWFYTLCRKRGQDIPVADGAPSFCFSTLKVSM